MPWAEPQDTPPLSFEEQLLQRLAAIELKLDQLLGANPAKPSHTYIYISGLGLPPAELSRLVRAYVEAAAQQ
jgi:hypothetical protein